MKRLFSFLLALAMLLAMSISVSAETYEVEHHREAILSNDPEEQAKITITNATAGKQYSVYKLFDADIADGKTADDSDGVTYTIDPDLNPAAFKALFGEGETPVNPYFDFNPKDKRISLKSNTTDGVALVKYFQELINNNPTAFPYLSETAEAGTGSGGEVIDQVVLEFEGLQYGYYLIKGNNDAVATLNSAAPSMRVIDKNQAPGNVDKQVKKKGAADTTYDTTSNTANIGDVVTYKIEFNATNYSGQEKLRFYNVVDVKGTGIWAEFNSFMVSIDGEQKPGYYLSDGGLNTNNWAALGEWGTTTVDPAEADWFLVHTGFDTYSILIPWIEEYTVEVDDELDEKGNEVIESVNIATTGRFKYDSPAEVIITYNAAIEPNANIGGSSSSNANLFNEVTVTWQTDKGTQDSSNTDKVYSETFGLTILKEDLATADNLAGAKFAVYKDEARNYPLYVIPTGVDGVYMVDSKGTEAENVSGEYMETARDYFQYLRTPDGQYVLRDETDPNSWIRNEALEKLGDGQTNEVVTAENGRLVILGLDLGTYHFVETEAPAGYNKLQDPFSIEITRDNSNHNYYIYADKEGNVQLQSDGADYTYTYALTNQPIQNSKGASLPSTGGEGLMMLISIGSMIAMAFAVLLITQKKMSIYKD